MAETPKIMTKLAAGYLERGEIGPGYNIGTPVPFTDHESRVQQLPMDLGHRDPK
jgi:hypothetical protein